MSEIDPLEVVKYRENLDGTVDVTFEATPEFIDAYKKATGAKRVTQKGIEKFVLALIEQATDEED